MGFSILHFFFLLSTVLLNMFLEQSVIGRAKSIIRSKDIGGKQT